MRSAMILLLRRPSLWLAAALGAWFVWMFLSHYPFGSAGGGGAGITPPWDKLIHFSGYGIVGVLTGIGLRLGNRWLGVYLAAGWVLAGCGAVDELLQLLIPAREFSWLDLLFNLLGGWFGLGLSGVPRGFLPLKPIE